MKRIPLTQGKVALVDDGLFEELNQFKWSAAKNKKTFYAMRCGPRGSGPRIVYLMHREVFRLLGEAVPERADHEDRNGLNNQRHNLRAATHSESNRNRGRQRNNKSGFIGVSSNRGQWLVQCRIKGKRKCIGRFDDKFSAAWNYDEFVKKHFPEFGVTNNLTDRRLKNTQVTIDRRQT